MRSSRFLKNIVFYFIGTFSTKLIQFLFIPLYTAYIITSDFGYFNLTISIISLAVPLLYQSIWEGILRFSIEDENNKKKVLSTTNIYCLGITILYSAIFMVVSKFLDIQYGVLILILGLSQMGVAYWQFSARALKENKIYALSTVVNSIITVSLNLFLIIVLEWGLLALFVANTFGNLAMIIVIESKIKLIKNTKKVDFSLHLLKSILKYSLPLSINALSWWLITSSNNLVISSRIGISENGIYSMASRFGSIMTLITSVINMAWLEESFRTFNDTDKDQYFNSVLNILTRIVLSGVALLIPLTFIFYNLFVFGDYYKGVYLTPIVYLSAAYSTLAAHLGSAFLARKESDIVFKTTLLGGIVSVAGGYILAKPFGLIGVVGTSLLGFMIMYIKRIPLLNRRMNLKINYYFLFGMTALCLIVTAICTINVNSFIYQVVVFIIVAAIIAIINWKIIVAILKQIKKRMKRN